MQRSRLPIIAACLLCLGGVLLAQDDREGGAYYEDLLRATRYARQGKRAAARTKFEDILAAVELEEAEEDRPSKSEQAEAWVGLAIIDRQVGEYANALEKIGRARALAPRPVQDLEAARVLALTGAYAKAVTTMRAAAAKSKPGSALALNARYRLGRLLDETGKHDEAKQLFAAVEDEGKRRKLAEPGAKLAYARALIALGGADRLYEASQVLIEVTREDPLAAEAYVARGDLLFRVYREARGRPSGESEYKRALESCGENEAALVALYTSRKGNFLLDAAKTDRFLKRALAVNPNSVPAIRAKASSIIDDRRFRSARSLLKRALAINPRDKRTLAEMAAVSHLLYLASEEKAYRERALRVDPGFARLDTVLGEHLVALYRFADAVHVLRKAQQKAPDDPRTLLALGRSLIYAGQGQAGAAVLERTKKLQRGYLNPWRENQLFLQERLDEEYERVEVGNFVFSLHPSEKGVLLPYLEREYEAAWKRLGTKYGTFPDCKVHVEDFARFGDFSVRTIGFKGFGALGACFGCFITSVSPAAPELRSQFSWKVTAWHEFAHVLHLKLSKARIPRWLTEGAAVYEEISLDASFDRRMEREMLSALRNDDIIPLERLNSVFRGPRILLGYYQGGLICRHIAKQWGFDKVVAIIKAYAADQGTGQIFERVLGISPREYDIRFRDWLNARLGSYTIVPAFSEAAVTKLMQRVARDPGDVAARLHLAQAFEQSGNTIDAGQQIAALRKLDADNGDAYLLRARMLYRRKDMAGARKLLAKGFENGGDDFDSRMLYASILEKASREKDALEQYAGAIRCWPTCSQTGDASPWLRRAAILRRLGHADQAAREIIEYVRFNGKDYGAHTALATWYRKKGDTANELRHLEFARDIDPFDRKLHERLAEIYLQHNEPKEAAFVLRICIAIDAEKDRSRRTARAGVAQPGPVDPAQEKLYRAGIRVRLAEALVAAGDAEAARAAARKALEQRAGLGSDLVERAQAVLERR